jgi:hypothetical protein
MKVIQTHPLDVTSGVAKQKFLAPSSRSLILIIRKTWELGPSWIISLPITVDFSFLGNAAQQFITHENNTGNRIFGPHRQ